MRKIKQPWLKLAMTLGYLAFVFLMYRLGVRCLFQTFLHFPCPGCGMTRALASLLRLDLSAALSYHPMVLSLPILYIYFLWDGKVLPKPWMDRAVGIILPLGFAAHWARLLCVEFC